MSQLLELVIEASYSGQQVINRWNYNGSGTPTSMSLSFALAKAFGAVPAGTTFPTGTVFEAIRNCLTGRVIFVQILSKLIYDPTDFYTMPFADGVHGLQTGDGSEQSPTQAYGFTTNLVRRDVGRGTKRLPGVLGNAVVNQGEIGTTQMNWMNALAAKMSDTLTIDDSGATLSFQPVIAGKNKIVNEDGSKKYKYYPTESEQQAKLAVGVIWVPYKTVRTQTSRQFKKGA
jgi:hypothetical protein